MPRGRLALVDHAALPAGDEYAEQQFLGGFIALRFVKDPAARAGLFPAPGRRGRPADQQVARANIGRAAPMRRWATAPARYSHYRLAAAYPETFYGQLALARIEPAPVLHLNETRDRGRRRRAKSRAIP